MMDWNGGATMTSSRAAAVAKRCMEIVELHHGLGHTEHSHKIYIEALKRLPTSDDDGNGSHGGDDNGDNNDGDGWMEDANDDGTMCALAWYCPRPVRQVR